MDSHAFILVLLIRWIVSLPTSIIHNPQMKKLLTIFFLFFILVAPTKSFGQIKRSEWSYGVVFQTDNFVYTQVIGNGFLKSLPAIIAGATGGIGSVEKTEEFYTKNAWWIPDFMYRANVVQKLEFANGNKATIYPNKWGFSHMDWKLRTYSIGYHVGFLPRIFPIGFEVAAEFAQDGYRIRTEDMENLMNITRRTFNATALLKIRLMRYDNNLINPVIELGTSYNHALHYHDDYINDKDAVNSGFTGIIGLGYTNTESHITFTLRYEHAFYNFYNRDFLFEGRPIFEDSKSTFGRLGFNFC